MNKQTILQKIDNIRAGTFHRATFLSKPKPASAFKDVSLVKITSGVFRFGIKYRNMKQNEGKETGPLSWGAWSVPNWLIRKNPKDPQSSLYLRFYTTQHTPKVEYYVNGEKVTREVFENYLVPSQRNRESTGVFNKKIEDIIAI